jgi:hypothetical protein
MIYCLFRRLVQLHATDTGRKFFSQLRGDLVGAGCCKSVAQPPAGEHLHSSCGPGYSKCFSVPWTDAPFVAAAIAVSVAVERFTPNAEILALASGVDA